MKNIRKTKPAIDRAMSKIEIVTESGCWIFMGALSCGYGVVGTGLEYPKQVKVHRLLYEHFVGVIPDGLYLCHRCDVPSCCNPNHMFVGTAKDNIGDMMKKGRGNRTGEHQWCATLTKEDVLRLKEAKKNGENLGPITLALGVSRSTGWRAANGETWRHV